MSSAGDRMNPEGRSGRLLAVYDLSCSPTSYDCLTFLALAEMKRRSGRYRCFDVVFVPAEGAGFWNKEATSLSEKQWRLRNLLVPMCWLWPACSSVSLLGSRGEADRLVKTAGRHVFPERYRVSAPIAEAFQLAHVLAARACGEAMPAWEAPSRARELVAAWLEPRARGRRVVVITLREASYQSVRNSSLERWTDFARRLDPQRYLAVFVRDTERAFEPLPDAYKAFETFPTASISLAVRAALYEASFLSMMSSGGPANLLFFNPRCHGVICDLLLPSEPRSSATVMRSLGLEIGRQAPLLGVTRHLVWDQPKPAELFDAFSRLVGIIEGAPARSTRQTLQDAEPPLRLARRLRETGRYAASWRIYTHEASRLQRPAAALCGLSLIALELPPPCYRGWPRVKRRLFYYRRKVVGAYYFARARRARLDQWQGTDEGLEIALCLESWNRHSAARAIYRAILDQDPAEPTAHYRLALDARDRGDRDEAIRELASALASDPHSGRFHLAMAEILASGGESASARSHYVMALSCDPSIKVPAEIRAGAAQS